MIKNERQYRITKAQVERFDRAVANFATEPVAYDVHPLLREAEQNAIEAQLNELRQQVEEYESLRAGNRTVLKFENIADLPRGLIRARIAAGVTHKELAERLGVPEQQVQRYEATDYATLTLPRLADVARALGVSVREDIFLPSAKVTTKTLFERLGALGLDREFLVRRLGFRHTVGPMAEADDSLALRMASLVHRVFGIAPEDIFSSRAIGLNAEPLLTARFKKPARGDRQRADAYTVYAHYIALLVFQASTELPIKPVPADSVATHQAIVAMHGEVTFETALRYAWSLGVPIIPLTDSGAFHGAFWRLDGRNVIVLKQRTTSGSRWLFDLLHELFHASQEAGADERSVIEVSEDADARWASTEEQHAMQYAGDVSLSGKAHALAEECVRAAHGSVERLKGVVPKVAVRHRVDPGSLANYIAFRLSVQTPRLNWWGAATNLQGEEQHSASLARDVLLEHLDLTKLNEVDQSILLQALFDREV